MVFPKTKTSCLLFPFVHNDTDNGERHSMPIGNQSYGARNRAQSATSNLLWRGQDTLHSRNFGEAGTHGHQLSRIPLLGHTRQRRRLRNTIPIRRNKKRRSCFGDLGVIQFATLCKSVEQILQKRRKISRKMENTIFSLVWSYSGHARLT